MSLEEVDRLARLPYSVVISCELELNFDTLLSHIWEYLSLLRVYTKKRGGLPYIPSGRSGIVRYGSVCVSVVFVLGTKGPYVCV